MNNKILNNVWVANIQLINEFAFEVTDERESLEETADRVIGWKGGVSNPCDVFELADMFISLSDVFDYFNFKASSVEFVDWYWESLDCNIRNKPYLKFENWLVKNRSKKFDKT